VSTTMTRLVKCAWIWDAKANAEYGPINHSRTPGNMPWWLNAATIESTRIRQA
jgi:hypothetical protein